MTARRIQKALSKIDRTQRLLRCSGTFIGLVLAAIASSIVLAEDTPTKQTPKKAVVISERSEVISETTAGCRLEKFTLHSVAMGRDIRVVVILPPGYDLHPDKQCPVLYTLHGRGAPYTSWAGMTPLINRLKEKPMIVTCFDGGCVHCHL